MSKYVPEPPAGGYIGISDEGDECIVKRFDSRDAAVKGAEEFGRGSAGNLGLKYMPTEVAYYGPEMLELLVARYRRLKELTSRPHKHGSNRLQELRQIEAILRAIGPSAIEGALGEPVLDQDDPRRDGVDATGQQGGASC